MKFTVLTALMCCSLLTGCAWQQDLLSVRDRLVILEQRARELEDRNEGLKKDLKVRIEDYSKTQEEKEHDLRNQSAGLQATFEGFKEELQVLRGKIEETDFLLSRKVTGTEESLTRIESRMQKLEQLLNSSSGAYGTAPGTVSAEQAAPAPQTASVPQPAADVSEDDLYKQAKQALDQNDFQTAQNGFKKLLEAYPKSRYADNAHFWLGEVYYRQKWYEKAILEYQNIIEKYPKGNKIKAAYLKQGFAFFNLGDKANARLILEELVSKHPGTEEAKIAKDKLAGF
jgi:tol-pal system protein YbgF